jgi:hypothetical protein
MNCQPPPFLDRSHLFAAIFFATFIFLVYQMAGLLAPFSSSLLRAAVIAVALAPLFRQVLRLVKGRTGLAAVTMTFGALLSEKRQTFPCFCSLSVSWAGCGSMVSLASSPAR